MATERFTRPSSTSCEIHEEAAPSLDLDFPSGDARRLLPPRIPLATMVQRNRQLRQWFPNGLKSPEERWSAKTTAEFYL